jgi:anti-sigma-K factor RskA
MSELNEMDCQEMDNVAAELALGVLTGRERAQALAHLERCDACRENVRQLAMTGEGLLALLPAAEPPAGFESRVLERIGLSVPAAPAPVPAPSNVLVPGPAQKPAAGARRAPKRASWAGQGRVRRMLAAAAVAVGIVGAGAGGWGLREATAPAAHSTLSTAAFISAGHQNVGQIIVFRGNPGWLYMSLDLNTGSGVVTCEVITATGHVSVVGWFRLNGGYGTWSSPDPAGGGTLSGARIVAADGTVLATAKFSKT